MTIFTNFDPSSIASGTTLTSLGWTEYPGVASGGAVLGAPNWRVLGGALTYNYMGGAAIPPRVLFDVGQPFVRGRVQIRDGEICTIMLAANDMDFINVRREHFGSGAGYNDTINFVLWRHGAEVSPNTEFNYFLRYNSSTTYNQYQTLPAIVQLEWVVSGNIVRIYLDGVLQKVFPGATNVGTVTDLVLPAWLVGAQKAGYTSPFNIYAFSSPLQMRDNNDITIINTLAKYRYNTTRSGLQIDFSTSIAGATSGNVTVLSAGGATLFSGSAALTGGAGTIRLGPVPAGNEGTLLAVSVTNVGGAIADTYTLHFPMPLTLPQAPVSIGNNQSQATYYNGFNPLNDIAKFLDWNTVGSAGYEVLPPWANTTDFNFAGRYQPASTIGRAANGSPTKFPDDPTLTIGAQMAWSAGAGEYVWDATQTPNLSWHFTNAGGLVSVDLNYYGTLKHRLKIAADFVNQWGIVLDRDTSKANNGLPTTAWSWSMVRVGTNPAVMPWNQKLLNFWGASAAGHVRHMDDQRCNEETQNIPFDAISAANRVQVTDQAWVLHGINANYPIEALVTLHNAIGKDMWLNIQRPCDDSYVRALAAYIRDHLNPAFKVYWTRSNETWNYQFPQSLMYRRRGWQQGLGKQGGGAIVNASTNGTTLLTVNSVTSGVSIAVGMPVRCAGVPDGAVIASFGTGTGGAGNYNLSSPANATGTDASAVIGGAVFGANNGSYAFGGPNGEPPAWVAGSYVVDQLYGDNGSIWRCSANVSGSVAPHNDPDHWTLWQDGNFALRRAHIEHIQAMRASLVSVFGGETAFKARNKIVCETWSDGFATWLPDYLQWGNNYALIDAVAIAPYFAAATFQYYAASPALRNAVLTMTGAPRIAQFKAEAQADMRRMLGVEAANGLTLINTLTGMGLPANAVALWCYESGKNYNFDFSAATLASNGVGPIDQTALYNDILSFFQNEQYDIYTEFYRGLADIHGGSIAHYSTIFPYTQSNFWPNPRDSYLAFGTSASLTDLADTSTMFKGLRDVSTGYGGTITAAPAKRRAGAILL